ncbi:MAG: Na/Pi cotransporter family protein [Eubacterium sp.]|nr:Na/Pi cotransporter family protein [Eubacterium sp.]
MGIVNIINLFGGLGLFLFGMKYMSEGINQVAGPKMKNMLERLTRNPVKGFFLGVLVTAVIQSSSAATVMVMGFLNAGIMDMAQATGVIIGTNIGTTITAVLIAVDVSAIAPICIFIGTVLALFSKKQSKKYLGQIILGFGILFFGLKYMSGDAAMGVLKTSESFQHFITLANNPLLGILIGVLICSVLQSSSAAVGVLQVLALQGLMPLSFSFFLIIGINVGSVMPLFISSFGAKTNAKRAVFIFFFIDFIGMLIFTSVALLTPFLSWVETLSANGSVQVAIAHIIFKTVPAILLVPFIKQVGKLSEKLIPAKEHDSAFRFTYIDKRFMDNPSASVLQVSSEVERMATLVRKNIVLSCEDVLAQSIENAREIKDNEELINWLNHHISDFLVTLSSHDLNAETSESIGKLFHVITDLERIGDHALNILERNETALNGSLDFSEAGRKEFETIYEKALELFDRSVGAFVNKHLPDEEEQQLHFLEDTIDSLTLQSQDNHVQRLRDKTCHTASGVVFTKLLQDLERIGDHSYNIAWAARKDKKLIRQI